MIATDASLLQWSARAEPLSPCAVVGVGAAARRLAVSLLARDDAALARLQGVAGASVVAVLGPAEELPWADGVIYLGRDPGAPSLLLPTRALPTAPLALFERAILRAHREARAPIVVTDAPPLVVSLAAARAITRGHVERWLARGA